MENSEHTPPRVWTWDAPSGGKFANINRPVAGATHAKDLPVGDHPLQLYSLATPNGVKVTILLEELLERGIAGAAYDAHLIDISAGDQFGSGFVAINPNSKIPALVDRTVQPHLRVFESGSILLYLAEKFEAFIPADLAGRTECLNWLFWQMGSAPFLGGGFGHFYAYAPEKYEYPINRYAMEAKRQFDVLDRQLSAHEYIAGGEYTIADMAIWPWYGAVLRNEAYDAAEFLAVHSYTHVARWVEQVGMRPAVQRGRLVTAAASPTVQMGTEATSVVRGAGGMDSGAAGRRSRTHRFCRVGGAIGVCGCPNWAMLGHGPRQFVTGNVKVGQAPVAVRPVTVKV